MKKKSPLKMKKLLVLEVLQMLLQGNQRIVSVVSVAT
jgi:hypothetical protein